MIYMICHTALISLILNLIIKSRSIYLGNQIYMQIVLMRLTLYNISINTISISFFRFDFDSITKAASGRGEWLGGLLNSSIQT